jgi:hypothetical protein
MLPVKQWKERASVSIMLAQGIRKLPTFPNKEVKSYDLYKFNPRLEELADLLEMDASNAIRIAKDIDGNDTERSNHFINLKVNGR